MRNIAILGSTGSIGTNTLDVVSRRPRDFRVTALSGYSNVKLLAAQIKKFRPRIVSVKDEPAIKKLKKLVDLRGIKVYPQDQGLLKIAEDISTQVLVVATTGTISLLPTLAALERGKIIALANKEPLVMAGQIVMERVRKSKGLIIPVDSEHSAVFQALKGEDRKKLRRIFLTGSGGPFLGFAKRDLKKVTLEMALNHPRWKMGKKISVDSATMMNKGLEIIEARWLFDVPAEKIEVLVHPEAIIHSMVEFCDGSVIAQMAVTDMRLPIQYALDYPQRRANDLSKLDFCRLKTLNFLEPNTADFGCLKIAKEAAGRGGSSGCVMNAANEVAVAAFLERRIGFIDIPNIISKVMKKHKLKSRPTLEEIFALDAWARREAGALC